MTLTLSRFIVHRDTLLYLWDHCVMTNHLPIIEKRVPVLFTVKDVAKILNISRNKVHALIKDESLESAQIGRSRRVTEGQLLKFIREIEGESPN